MTADRLRQITLVFPNADPEARAFWTALVHLLSDLPGADVRPDRLLLTPTQPTGAFPITSFHTADVPIPLIVFTPTPHLDLTVGGLHLGAGNPRGSGPAVSAAPPTHPALLSAADVARRVRGHVTRLDHTGVDLPAASIGRSRWDDLVRRCAASAALYRYPGEEWPFILPSTDDEFRGDIGQFVVGREPRFELVHDPWAPEPVLQFSLGVDLPRAEIEARFPDPEGRTFAGLEDIFRTVYVTHPWSQLRIRMDLNYRGEGGTSDWETGEWLVTHGGRIRATARPDRHQASAGRARPLPPR